MSMFFKNYSLAELTYLWIRLNNTKSFLGNTKKTNRNSVNVENAHKTIALEMVSKAREGGQY